MRAAKKLWRKLREWWLIGHKLCYHKQVLTQKYKNSTGNLTPWNWVFTEANCTLSQSRNPLPFKELEGSYHVHKSLTPEPDSIHTLQPIFPKIHFNIIHQSMPRSSNCSLNFSTRSFYALLIYQCMLHVLSIAPLLTSLS
jgi:hypothetical protein